MVTGMEVTDVLTDFALSTGEQIMFLFASHHENGLNEQGGQTGNQHTFKKAGRGEQRRVSRWTAIRSARISVRRLL